MDNKIKFTAAMTLALAALSQNANAHMEPKKNSNMEKCYGVVKAGKNDCVSKANSHSCATMAKTDSNPNEWVKLPKGLCERLAGGSLKPTNSG